MPPFDPCKASPFVSTSVPPVGNTLFAALAREEYEHLPPALEPVEFSLGNIVYEPGGHLGYLYFPVTAIVSLVFTVEKVSAALMSPAESTQV
jgi:hypothetical protein